MISNVFNKSGDRCGCTRLVPASQNVELQPAQDLPEVKDGQSPHSYHSSYLLGRCRLGDRRRSALGREPRVQRGQPGILVAAMALASRNAFWFFGASTSASRPR